MQKSEVGAFIGMAVVMIFTGILKKIILLKLNDTTDKKLERGYFIN